MSFIFEWLGKAEDLPIEYDAGILKTQLLPGKTSLGDNLPAIIYNTSNNIRDVEEVAWNTSLKKADRLDCLMAVCCGTIAGLVDVFFVGDFSLERANKWGTDKVGSFVKRVAKLQGYKGDDLSDAIMHLEKRWGIPADRLTPNFGGGLQHHLRDFSHHFCLSGLLCSIFTQFSGMVIGTDTSGTLQMVKITDTTFIGKNFAEKVLFGTVNWIFHMVSDMAGSNMTPGRGTGIPGPIVSLIKELSAIPLFKDKKIGEHEFHVWVSKLFNGTLLAKRDNNGNIEARRFDLRTEIGILQEIGRQFVPVIINECLVRGLYFIRRLCNALQKTPIHSFDDLKSIDISELLPFNNRAIIRMVTISTGTFTVIDAVDASVRAALKSGGNAGAFLLNFAVRINFVGIGRFIIACKTDISFITEELREEKEKRERIQKEYEKIISNFDCLTLSYEQLRVLNSLERLIVVDDIYNTKKDEEFLIKFEWKKEWEKQTLSNYPLTSGTNKEFFLLEKDVLEYIRSRPKNPMLYWIAMEAIMFTPYSQLFVDQEKNKAISKVKCNSAYIYDKFTQKQKKLTKSIFTNLEKEYKHSARIITGSDKNLLKGAVATAAVAVATGGLAFTFAPVIATALVGNVAGLSGAALTSFSLAAVGGGSLAAGGLGMAGGTAIITGGGALLGMLGSGGISAATTINLLSDNGYVLAECCKLLTFSREVLINIFNDAGSVFGIKAKIESRSMEVNNQIEMFEAIIKEESDNDKKKDIKSRIQVAKKSLAYLDRTSEELGKLIRATGSILSEYLALPSGA